MSKTFYNEILVATVGLTPETVTEAIYYYYKQSEDKRLFSNYKLITTTSGKDGITKSLFKDGWLNKLEIALGLEKDSIPLTEDSIIVIEDKDGNPIMDIRTTHDADQERLMLFELFNELTEDNNSRITASIAGGRKTTSASIALALQVYGRDQDDLIHVMVPENKRQENVKEPWFFPSHDDEIIEISRLPIIKTRKLMGSNLPFDSPEILLEMAQVRLEELSPIDKLIIQSNRIEVGSHVITLSPINMMIWRYLARNKIEKCTAESNSICSGCSGCYVSHHTMIEELDTKILNEYSLILGKNSERYMDFKAKLHDQKTDANGWSDKDSSIRQYRSKLNKQIKENASYSLANQLKPQVIEDDESITLFGLQIKKNAIHFEDGLE